jgi:hypothetical protein
MRADRGAKHTAYAAYAAYVLQRQNRNAASMMRAVLGAVLAEFIGIFASQQSFTFANPNLINFSSITTLD